MSSRNRSLPLFVILFIGLLAMAVYSDWLRDQIPPETAQQAQEGAGTNNDPWWVLRWTSDDWIATFTGVLTFATIGMWFVMWRTLFTTKRAVEAQINGQRGKLVFINGTRTIAADGSMHLDHSFRNIGAGRIMIKSFKRDIRAFKVAKGTHIGPDYELPYLTEPARQYEETIYIREPIVVAEMGVVETQDPNPVLKTTPNEIETRHKLSDEHAGALKGGKFLMIQYAITYETAFGDYELRCAWYTGGIPKNRRAPIDYESDLSVKR